MEFEYQLDGFGEFVVVAVAVIEDAPDADVVEV